MRWYVAKEGAHRVNREAGAAGTELQGVLPVSRSRSAGMARAAEPHTQPMAWAGAMPMDATSLLACLETLQHRAPETIARQDARAAGRCNRLDH